MKKKGIIKNQKFFWGLIASVCAIFILLLVLVAGVYKYDWNNRFFLALERVIPFPAVFIKGAGIISTGELKNDSQAVKKFYESQDFEKIGMRIDFDTEQGKKRLKLKEKDIINKLVENKIIENLANRRDILITDAMVDQEVNSAIEQFGNRENLMSDLSRLYGWTLDDFKRQVVKPELYSDRLTQAYEKEIDVKPQENKIKALYEKLTVKKEDFAQIASKESEGKSAENGGDLGWSSRDQLIEPVAQKAFSMKVGETSEIISSPLGFHIIKLEDKKTEDEKDLVHVRQIFVKKTTFAEWLKEKIKEYKVFVFLKDYRWNPDEGLVEFKNEDMRKFEENIDLNSQGDPSVFP